MTGAIDDIEPPLTKADMALALLVDTLEGTDNAHAIYLVDRMEEHLDELRDKLHAALKAGAK